MSSAPEEDRIRAGDIIRLQVWREEDLTGDFRVTSDRTVVLPKIGTMSVVDLTPDAFREAVVTEYRKYLRNPSIDLWVLRNVRVLGAVRRPGVYPLVSTMTLADALALAGGADEFGRQNRAELRRDGSRLVADLDPSTRLAELPLRTGDEIYVPERSWASRNAAMLATVVTTLAGVLIAVLAQ